MIRKISVRIKLIIALAIITISPSLTFSDTTKVFTIQDFFVQIMAHHPVAKQAQLLSEKAKQELRLSKGLLDPKIAATYYEKDLGGLDYFTIWDNQLKVPVWFGTDIKAGFEKNSGVNLNGENFTPLEGLSYMGITVPLGQGLIIDERRSVIKQARLLTTMAEAEKLKVINKLLLQAAKDYWEWSFRYERYLNMRESYLLGRIRFEAVKERVIHGDMSPVDTVEAQMNMQDREIQMNQSLLDYANTSLVVSNYLWSESEVPLEISENLIPSLANIDSNLIDKEKLNNLLIQAQNGHPEIIKLNTKIQQLNIERQFYADKLKPKLNLDYSIIQKGIDLNKFEANTAYLQNNYKVGLNFSYSLFLRQERGKISVSKIKIMEADYDLQQTGREILNNIKASYNEYISFREQIVLQRQMVNNARQLRDAEQQLFDQGESSLFLINAREINLINNMIKLSELTAKFQKSRYSLYWSAGNILGINK